MTLELHAFITLLYELDIQLKRDLSLWLYFDIKTM